MSRFWSKTVSNISPYIPGEQPRDKKYIKLNTNENPWPPSPEVLLSIQREASGDVRLYPDPESTQLKEALAEFYQVKFDEVFVGNGSDEVLAFCFPAFFNAGDTISFPDITYSFYPVYADLFNVRYEMISLRKDFTIPTEQFRAGMKGILLANPNAPTSIALDREEIERLLQSHKDTLIVVDEAYVDFGAHSMVSQISDYDNLLVVQTFSKSRSLAGLRIGYAIGNRQLIEGLERIKNSFNSYTLDRIAQKAGIAAVKDREYFASVCKRIIETREKTAQELTKLGFHILPSKTNFFFLSHEKVQAKELFVKLREEGILVRYFQKPRIENYLRVSIGTDEEMEILVEKLKGILRNA